jgi:hypothetical protein
MATKHTCSCLKKAADDEPIFVLRAQDKLAPAVVQYWIDLARSQGTPEPTLQEAERCMASMEAWPTKKVPD